MRTSTFLAFLVLAFVNGFAQPSSKPGFTLAGDLNNLKDPVSKVYIYYSNDGNWIEDSVVVKKRRFIYAGALSAPTIAYLRAGYPNKMPASARRDRATIFLDKGDLQLRFADSFKNVKVTGSPAHQEYEKWQAFTEPENNRVTELDSEYSAYNKAGNEEALKATLKKYKVAEAALTQKNKEFLQQNPSSPVALFVVQKIAGWKINPDDVQPFFDALPESIRNSAAGKDLLVKIERARKTAPGQLAMEFSQADTLGKMVSLSSFRGKYLLIDFWASWCGPCRKENPNLVKAYRDFSAKGFQILSVSLDQPTGKEKWLKAIHDDGLTWTHVSDLKFWENEVAKLYGIESIPQNLLLDPEGRIVSKNLYAEDLYGKLEEIFSKN